MKRALIALLLFPCLLACSESNDAPANVSSQSDATPATATTCALPDGRRIPAGASYANGCNCCVCTPDGQPACQGAACSVPGGDGGALDHYPLTCQSDADCLSGVCAFNPGCNSPSGTCMGGRVCPLFVLGATPVDQIQYCGCDGTTFSLELLRQYPYRPYRHVGACR